MSEIIMPGVPLRVTALCHPRFSGEERAAGRIEVFCQALQSTGARVFTSDSHSDKLLRQTLLMKGMAYEAHPLGDPLQGERRYSWFCEPNRLESVVLFLPRAQPWMHKVREFGFWDGIEVAICGAVYEREVGVHYSARTGWLIQGYAKAEGSTIPSPSFFSTVENDPTITQFQGVLLGAWNALAARQAEREEMSVLGPEIAAALKDD